MLAICSRTCGPTGHCVRPNMCKCDTGGLGSSCGSHALSRRKYSSDYKKNRQPNMTICLCLQIQVIKAVVLFACMAELVLVASVYVHQALLANIVQNVSNHIRQCFLSEGNLITLAYSSYLSRTLFKWGKMYGTRSMRLHVWICRATMRI